MADIPASLVVKLRKMSGQGMMDCKKALQEADSDIEKAMEILRKKGLATLSKRADRETTEGAIVAWKSKDDKSAGLMTLCCETDFVAKSDDFVAMTEAAVNYIAASSSDQGPENILKTEVNGKKFNDIVTGTVSKTGEKIQVGDFTKFKLDGPGLIGTYVHFNKKVASMVEIQTNSDDVADSDKLKQAASDIAMHITATNPMALDRSGKEAKLDWPKIIERERVIYAEQVKNKPANIIEKVVEGKMKKFYIDNCLLEQPFVKDDSKNIAQVLADAAKQAGGEASIKRFVRFEVG
jgi:elongation factor Ts